MVTIFGVDIALDYAKFFPILNKVIWAILVFAIGWIVIKLIIKAFRALCDRNLKDNGVKDFLDNVIEVVLWIVVVLIILSIFGVNVLPFVAGLGIAGLALGFALKDTLENFVNGIMIFIHKPFKVGEFIDIGSVKGSVQVIEISYCVLKTYDGIQVTVPNKVIWQSNITNYSANKTRMLDQNFGIAYSDDIGKAMKLMLKTVKKDKRVLKDPEPKIVAKELADSSVNLALRAWVSSDEFWPFKFEITKVIKEEFDKNKITIPFPQRDVHMKKK